MNFKEKLLPDSDAKDVFYHYDHNIDVDDFVMKMLVQKNKELPVASDEKVLQMYEENTTFNRAAKLLRNQRFVTKSGAQWTAGAVRGAAIRATKDRTKKLLTAA